MFKNRKLIIFDMDGCLIDTESVYADIWYKLFKEEHIPIGIEEITTWRGLGWEKIKDIIAKETNSLNLALELRERREEIYHNYLYNNQIKLKPYAKEAINYFKNEGYKIALGTSTYEKKAIMTLNYFKLVPEFDYLVFGDNVPNPKPSPDIFNLILEKSSTKPQEAIIFEDSYHGIKAANNANIDVVYIPDGNQIFLDNLKVLKIIKNFSEVIK